MNRWTGCTASWFVREEDKNAEVGMVLDELLSLLRLPERGRPHCRVQVGKLPYRGWQVSRIYCTAGSKQCAGQQFLSSGCPLLKQILQLGNRQRG